MRRPKGKKYAKAHGVLSGLSHGLDVINKQTENHLKNKEKMEKEASEKIMDSEILKYKNLDEARLNSPSYNAMLRADISQEEIILLLLNMIQVADHTNLMNQINKCGCQRLREATNDQH